jgi:predicted esterase
MRGQAKWVMSLLFLGVSALPSRSVEPERGFHPERRVRQAARLDWEFAAPAGARLPVRYDSRQQRYQLFVPDTYQGTGSWPLVVFVPPGDDPLGWRAWQGPCESGDWLFAAAYAAGTSCPQAQRVRAVLDVLDDVRRLYRIDPDRTYLAGFAAGAALACRIAFALPEHFGGVVVLSGDAPLPELEHLRSRAAERLSVALVATDKDPSRARQEKYLAPLCRDLGIRCRLWRVPGRGPSQPPESVLKEVQAWLDGDVKRRQADRRNRIGQEEATRRATAARALEQARKELADPDHLHRAAARLEWIAARWERTEASEQADRLLADLRADPRRSALLAAQAAASRKAFLAAQARALEASGKLQGARQAWEGVARLAEGDERRKAEGEARCLAGRLLRTPYLGVLFEGDTTAIQAVVPGGPAHRAGVRRGDRLEGIGTAKVATPGDVRRKIAGCAPGEVLVLVLLRGGKKTTLDVTVGSPPEKEE